MNRCLTAIWLSIGLAQLSGCMTPPLAENSLQALAPPVVEQSLQTDAQAEKIIREWPQQKWWQDFHNPELSRLIESALQDNPNLQAAATRVEMAAALSDAQAAAMLPTLSANAEFSRRRFSSTDFYGPNGGKTFNAANLDPGVFRYHLDIWGKDQANLEAALGREKAQSAELAMSRLLLSTEIARLYIQLCAAAEDEELLHVLSLKNEAMDDLNSLRWRQGISAEDAPHQSRQLLDQARQAENSAHGRVAKLRNRLAVLAGQGTDWGQAIQIEPLRIQGGYLPMPGSVSSGLLAHRPDVAAAQWRTEAAAKLVKVAETNFYPDINLVGVAGLHSLHINELFLSHGASVAYSMGPTLSLPIFEGGRLEAELKNQQAEYQKAVADYNQALLTAVQQVADSLADWRESIRNQELQTQAVRQAAAQQELAERRYRAGLSSADGALEANSRLLQQQLQASGVHAAHLIAALELISALGGGYQNNLQLNQHD